MSIIRRLTPMQLVAIYFIMYLAIVFIVGCNDSKKRSPQTYYGPGTLYTVYHDGHKFVTVGSGSGLLHHPDCACEKK